MALSIADGVFIGREAESADLYALLDEVCEGDGAIALVAGEPGIGKTYLLDRLRAYARGSEVVELFGLCSEDEGAPPYWPWVQALRPYYRGQRAGGSQTPTWLRCCAHRGATSRNSFETRRPADTRL